MSAPPASELAAGRQLLRAMFDAAVAAADPDIRIPLALGSVAPPPGRIIVVGAGKAAARMARAVEQSSWASPLLDGSVAGAATDPFSGLVVTRYGHSVPCDRIEVLEAAHPVPDEAGVRAARRILALAASAVSDDLVLALVSGGGSALLTLPVDGITLADKQSVTAQLLRSGATIEQINLVRRHLSAIKGGRLAEAAWPARTVGLLISDVPGDDPAAIASGPTVPDDSQPTDAADVLKTYDIDVPPAVWTYLAVPPRPRGPVAVENHVVAAPQQSLEAAAAVARAAGVAPLILGEAIEGESREVGTVLAGIAAQVRAFGQPVRPPCVLLTGGETTVRVRGDGTGGPNSELALAAAIALRGAPGVYVLACDTDGVDGAAEVAGALVCPDTLARAARLGLDARAALARNDAHTFFAALDDQIVTGPTLTNVNDFRAVLVT